MNMMDMRITMKINGIHMNSRGKPVDSSDLEEAIMNAWRTSDDIKAFYNSSEYMDEDQVMNALMGLEIFAEMRFNELWNTFEQCMSNGIFDDSTKRGEEIAKALDEATEGFGQEKL